MLTQGEFLKMLASHEVAMADLYRLYGDALPDEKVFWSDLSRQEKMHAAILGQLHDSLGRKAMVFREQACGEGEINNSLEFIERSTNQCMGSQITMEDALKVSRFLELGMIEQRFFQVFDQDDDEWRSKFEALRRHTTEHLKCITDKATTLGLAMR